MTSQSPASGYPDRYFQVVRRTVWISIVVFSVTGLIAINSLWATLHENWPPLVTAVALTIFLLFGVLASISSIIDSRVIRIIPYFPRTVGEISTFVSGYQLARNLRFLDEIATSAEVQPLSDFGFADDLRGEVLEWHRAEEGLKTVESLIMQLQTTHTQIDKLEAVLVELQTLRDALLRARDQQIEFCLILMHGNFTSGHEWSVRKGTAF